MGLFLRPPCVQANEPHPTRRGHQMKWSCLVGNCVGVARPSCGTGLRNAAAPTVRRGTKEPKEEGSSVAVDKTVASSASTRAPAAHGHDSNPAHLQRCTPLHQEASRRGWCEWTRGSACGRLKCEQKGSEQRVTQPPGRPRAGSTREAAADRAAARAFEENQVVRGRRSRHSLPGGRSGMLREVKMEAKG